MFNQRHQANLRLCPYIHYRILATPVLVISCVKQTLFTSYHSVAIHVDRPFSARRGNCIHEPEHCFPCRPPLCKLLVTSIALPAIITRLALSRVLFSETRSRWTSHVVDERGTQQASGAIGVWDLLHGAFTLSGGSGQTRDHEGWYQITMAEVASPGATAVMMNGSRPPYDAVGSASQEVSYACSTLSHSLCKTSKH